MLTPRLGILQGALHQSFDVIAMLGDMVEVRPLEFAHGRGVQQ